MEQSSVHVGIRGYVVALDRESGTMLWKTSLPGAEFVSLLRDGDRVLAATRGEMFCLDAASGHILWNNKLPGMGRGLISIATPNGSASPSAQSHYQQQDAQSSYSPALGTAGISS